jgi:hypothetical protein
MGLQLVALPEPLPIQVNYKDNVKEYSFLVGSETLAIPYFWSLVTSVMFDTNPLSVRT